MKISAATLGVVFDALYPGVDADANGGRTVELALVQAVASRLHLLR